MNPLSLAAVIADPANSAEVEKIWDTLGAEFDKVNRRKLHRYMERREVSFHSDVKLLGYAAIASRGITGDILEIGVWKGKSLALMHRLAGRDSKAIGIDPLELEGQDKEIAVFQKKLFPKVVVVQSYSEYGPAQVLALSRTFKIVHIDGGHFARNVWIDFLAYAQFVVPGGYLIFDDYADVKFSPEVGPAVDAMRELGLFEDFEIIGQVQPYANSYVLRRRA
jgi:hypothetical protein